MAKKLIALLLAVLMLAGMLAGCAKTAETPAPAAEDPADTSDSSSTTDTPAPSSDAEPIEISIAYRYVCSLQEAGRNARHQDQLAQLGRRRSHL